MKRAAIIFTGIIMLILLYMSFKIIKPRDISTAAIIALLLILAGSYLYFEKSSRGTKEIALIATLSAFAGASRVLFTAIPNVQPATFIIALSGYVFGAYEGFLTGATTAFISNIFLGQGPWTPWQMFAWGILGALSGLIGKGNRKLSSTAFAFICFFYGFIFDWIMNLWHVLGFIKPLTLQSILLVYMTSLSFDIMHSTGNFIFAVLFFDSFYRVMYRFKKRLQVTYIKNIL